MRHVAHVLHSLEVGGTEHGVVNLVNALGDLRHSVVSVTGSGPLAARLPAAVAVHCVGKQPGLDVRAIARMTGILRRLRPDVVHTRNWAAFDGVLAARLAGVRLVVHGEHGREAADPQGLNARRNRLRRLLAPLVTRFVTVSHDLRRWLVEVVRVPAGKVVAIHNGVDTERFGGDGREAGRRALGLPMDTTVFGTVSRLDPVKDHAGLLTAFRRLLAQAPTGHLALVVVGDGPCRARLEAQVRETGLAGHVRLLGERHDVPALLQGLDVYVLPSLAEGISNTILEAMATGLPVVATRTGGNPELVEDGVTGLLVPVSAPAALASALATYAADPVLRTLHGKAARERAVAVFGLDRMVDEYRRLYAALGAGRAA